MSDGGDLLEVATWNIRNGFGLDGLDAWPFRRRAAAAVLAGLGGDIVGLQEVHGWQQRPLRRALPDHVAVGRGRGRTGWGERCTVLVGPSLRIVRHRTLWLSPAPEVPGTRLPGASHPRVATFVEVERRATRDRLVVVNTHLDQRHEAHRLTSVELVLGWLEADVPAIVLGDLNARPGSAPLERLARAGFASVLPDDAGGTAHQLTGRVDGPRIDHVLVRGPWRVLDATIDHARPGGRLASDHWPVRALLHLGPSIEGCGSASSAPTA